MATFASKTKATMTKEEVAQVIAYCDETKISYKQRLAELGVNPWSLLKNIYNLCDEGVVGRWLENPYMQNIIKFDYE